MRTLIAVKSCKLHRDAGYHDVILNTWGKDVPPDVDLRFFVGEDGMFSPGGPQDVALGVPDEYMELPKKTRAIVDWSLSHGYHYAFLCDVDTFIIPRKLLRSGYERFDYSGRFGATPAIGTTFHYKDAHGDYPNCHPWASGGVGYFLSARAAEIIALNWPNIWAEDMWVGQVLGPYIHDGTITASDLTIECDSAWHFPRRSHENKPYDPKFLWMEKMYESTK